LQLTINKENLIKELQ